LKYHSVYSPIYGYISECTRHTYGERLRNLWKLFFKQIIIEGDLISVSTYI